jgi:DDE_Tnp_1-associated
VPALTSALISPALEQLARPPGDRPPPGGCSGLREFLSSVPDPRDPRGVRHSLISVLLASVAAVLAGSRPLAAIGEWVADAPPGVLAALGVRFDPPWAAGSGRLTRSPSAGWARPARSCTDMRGGQGAGLPSCAYGPDGADHQQGGL